MNVKLLTQHMLKKTSYEMNDKGMILKATTMTLSTLNDEGDDDAVNKDLKRGRRRRQWKRR